MNNNISVNSNSINNRTVRIYSNMQKKSSQPANEEVQNDNCQSADYERVHNKTVFSSLDIKQLSANTSANQSVKPGRTSVDKYEASGEDLNNTIDMMKNSYEDFKIAYSIMNNNNTLQSDTEDMNSYIEEIRKKSEQLKQFYKIKPNINLNQIIQLSARLARAANVSSVKSVMSSAGRTKAYFNSIISKCENNDKQIAKSAATQVSKVIVQGRRKINQLNKEQILENRKKAAIKEKKLRKARALSKQKNDSIVKRKSIENAHVACAKSWAVTTAYSYKNSLIQGVKQNNLINNLSNKISIDITKYRQLNVNDNNIVENKNDTYLAVENSLNDYSYAATSPEFSKIDISGVSIDSVQTQQIFNTGLII